MHIVLVDYRATIRACVHVVYSYRNYLVLGEAAFVTIIGKDKLSNSLPSAIHPLANILQERGRDRDRQRGKQTETKRKTKTVTDRGRDRETETEIEKEH